MLPEHEAKKGSYSDLTMLRRKLLKKDIPTDIYC
jgi:hypothetical protein